MKLIKQFLIIVPMIILLAGCGDPTQEKITALESIVLQQIESLNDKLQNKQLRNALILESYINKVYDSKPELKELFDNLKGDIKANNPRIEEYKKRFNTAKSSPKSLGTKDDVLQELYALSQATNVEIYNDSLIDVINTVADLSDGQLQRINVKRKDTADENNGPGSHLVGNSQYGGWQNRGGQSMWVWYGQYRLFSDLLWRRPYYYSSWHYNRPWSYHNDYGRGIYGSRSDRTSHANLQKTNSRQLKQYGNKTGRNSSSYSKRTNSNFKPSNATSSASRRGSTYGASHRSGSRSRSSFGGK